MLHLHAFDETTQKDPVLAWIGENHSRLPTPLYLYSAAALAQSVGDYRSLFPPGARGFYSLKSNPQPGLVHRLGALGLGAEVVSPGEWQVAREVGAENILVGGVSRSAEFFAEVIEHAPTALIIDSEREWQRLGSVASPNRPVDVLFRINPGVSFGGLNMAGGTQFGLSPEQALALAKEATQGPPGVHVLGLHIYFGSQRLKTEVVLKALGEIEKVMPPFRDAGLLQVIDLGLGLGVPYLGRDIDPDLEELSQALQTKWRSKPWAGLDIWFEAGRALVARSGYFISRVTEKKTLHDKTFVFLDGGLSVHNPGIGVGRFFRDNPRFCFLTQSDPTRRDSVEIVGNLCTSADQLGGNVEAPELEEGDLVVVPNAGAYTTTTGMWGFNSQGLFAEAVLEEDQRLEMLAPQYSLLAKFPPLLPPGDPGSKAP